MQVYLLYNIYCGLAYIGGLYQHFKEMKDILDVRSKKAEWIEVRYKTFYNPKKVGTLYFTIQCQKKNKIMQYSGMDFENGPTCKKNADLPCST
jgi:hypothetical protein